MLVYFSLTFTVFGIFNLFSSAPTAVDLAIYLQISQGNPAIFLKQLLLFAPPPLSAILSLMVVWIASIERKCQN